MRISDYEMDRFYGDPLDRTEPSDFHCYMCDNNGEDCMCPIKEQDWRRIDDEFLPEEPYNDYGDMCDRFYDPY